MGVRMSAREGACKLQCWGRTGAPLAAARKRRSGVHACLARAKVVVGLKRAYKAVDAVKHILSRDWVLVFFLPYIRADKVLF